MTTWTSLLLRLLGPLVLFLVFGWLPLFAPLQWPAAIAAAVWAALVIARWADGRSGYTPYRPVSRRR